MGLGWGVGGKFGELVQLFVLRNFLYAVCSEWFKCAVTSWCQMDIFYNDPALTNPKRRKVTFLPLQPGETLKKGDLVGLDAEFISLKEVTPVQEVASQCLVFSIFSSWLSCSFILVFVRTFMFIYIIIIFFPLDCLVLSHQCLWERLCIYTL